MKEARKNRPDIVPFGEARHKVCPPSPPTSPCVVCPTVCPPVCVYTMPSLCPYQPMTVCCPPWTNAVLQPSPYREFAFERRSRDRHERSRGVTPRGQVCLVQVSPSFQPDPSPGVITEAASPSCFTIHSSHTRLDDFPNCRCEILWVRRAVCTTAVESEVRRLLRGSRRVRARVPRLARIAYSVHRGPNRRRIDAGTGDEKRILSARVRSSLCVSSISAERRIIRCQEKQREREREREREGGGGRERRCKLQSEPNCLPRNFMRAGTCSFSQCPGG